MSHETNELNPQQRRELALSLLDRSDVDVQAAKAFRRAYPTAPEEMIRTAVFHVYVDGPGAVIDWLADAELFLCDPNHKLSVGTTFHLLYHIYNWHQFRALLPIGTSEILQLLKELKETAADGELEAVQQSVGELEEIFEGHVNHPDFE